MGDDADFCCGICSNRCDVGDDGKGFEIAGESEDFDVIGASNDDDEVACMGEIECGLVEARNQRASSVDECFSSSNKIAAAAIGDAVRSDNDALGGGEFGTIRFRNIVEALCFKLVEDDVVVNEFSIDGDGRRIGN